MATNSANTFVVANNLWIRRNTDNGKATTYQFCKKILISYYTCSGALSRELIGCSSEATQASRMIWVIVFIIWLENDTII